MKSTYSHLDKLFESFNEAYEDLLMNDSNEAKKFLMEEGYDIETVESVRKKIEFKVRATINKQKDELLLEKAFKKLQAFAFKNSELFGDELKTLLRRVSPAYQFRNLEKLDDDGIREILTEVDLVKLLEELEKEENG